MQIRARWFQGINVGRQNHGHSEGDKLRTYVKFKYIFQKESYLNSIKNTAERALFTNFRISAHSLEIELGRYRNTPAEARLCPHCDLNKVDTEIHFLLECPKYQNLRNDLIKNALKIFVKTIGNSSQIFLLYGFLSIWIILSQIFDVGMFLFCSPFVGSLQEYL
jgi:hypothetical protein